MQPKAAKKAPLLSAAQTIIAEPTEPTIPLHLRARSRIWIRPIINGSSVAPKVPARIGCSNAPCALTLPSRNKPSLSPTPPKTANAFLPVVRFHNHSHRKRDDHDREEADLKEKIPAIPKQRTSHYITREPIKRGTR